MYTIHPIIKGKLVLIQLSEHMSLRKLTRLNDDLTALLIATPHDNLHFIIKPSNLQSFPNGIFALRQVLTCLQHEKMGWILMTGDNQRLIMSLSIVVQLAGGCFRHTQTDAQTWRFLHYMDITLQIPFNSVFGNSQRAINQDQLLLTPPADGAYDSTFAR